MSEETKMTSRKPAKPAGKNTSSRSGSGQKNTGRKASAGNRTGGGKQGTNRKTASARSGSSAKNHAGRARRPAVPVQEAQLPEGDGRKLRRR